MQEKKELECLIFSDVLCWDQRFFLHESLRKKELKKLVLAAAKAVGPRANKRFEGFLNDEDARKKLW